MKESVKQAQANKVPGQRDFERQGISFEMIEKRRELVAETEAALKEVRADASATPEQKAERIQAIRKEHETKINAIRK